MNTSEHGQPGTLPNPGPQTPGPGLTDRQAAGWAAAAGIVAVGTGLALGELAAGLVSPSLSPVTAVGGAV
ncbi:MAG TPA: oxidoreductase, partial [Arthrobacter sp.]